MATSAAPSALTDGAATEGNGKTAARARRASTAPARTRVAMPAPRGPGLSEGFSDPEQQLQEEMSNDRIMRLRADAGEQFIENLQIPNHGDLWVPGYRLITEELARETGLRGMEDDPFPDIPLEEEQPASGAVDGNIIASFLDGVTGQQKHDVLNSCLLAQLAANAKFPRASKPVEWTNAYGTVLMNLAWVVPSFRYTSLRTSAQRFTIDRVILKLVQGFLNPAEIAQLTATMEAMKELEGEDRRFVIFERNAKGQSDGNFQVDSVGTSADGTLSLKLGAYAFDTNTTVTNVLWFSFSGNNTALKAAKSTFVLNEEVFARLREPILNKLGQRAIDYIGGLETAEG